MNELITENFAMYENDCMNVVNKMSDDSIDLSIYSPPFAGLYKYSSSDNDFSNNATKKGFLDQYEFLVKEMGRITKPGRINAVHCQDVVTNTTKHNLWDFPHEIIELHKKYGFHYRNRITIWKEPLRVRMRTMVQSLMHKRIVEDSTGCFPAIPDYILIFVKAGENKIPVEHPTGLKIYHGETPMLPAMAEKYGDWGYIKEKFENWKDPKTNKLSHIIWQRYASSVWDDIRPDSVLPFKDSKEDDDEKHVHPLQLDIIERLVILYSNRGEIVFTPFMGVGSEVYGAVINERRGIGAELKSSYFRQAVMNLENIKRDTEQPSLYEPEDFKNMVMD